MDGRRQVVCQKVFTRGILTFALEHVRRIPKVGTEGYQKASTKSAFAQAPKELKHDSSEELNSWMLKKSDVRGWTQLNHKSTALSWHRMISC